MAITQQQLENTLNLKGVFSLINGAASLTDISAWSSIGVTSAKILLQINDSTGALVYQNSGYLTANYGSPDLDVLAGPPVPTFSYTLPQDISGQYLQGTYTINTAIQLISSFGIQTFSYTVYENVNSCCNGIVANGTPNVNYLNAQISVTDNTNYGNYQAISNTLTLYPDPTTNQAKQSQTFNGTPATLIWQPPTGQRTYTGTWKWTLNTVLTYIDPATGSSTQCAVIGSGSFEVNQNPICNVLCNLNKYVTQTQLAQANSLVNASLMERQLLMAQGYFALLLGQNDCGANGQPYVDMIYRLIGVNPKDGCGCGCNDVTVQPLIPTQSINGTNGTDGLSFLNGTSTPASGLGVVGDSYLDTTTYDIYTKTNSGWSVVCNIKGAPGAPGAPGATGPAGLNGSNGAAIIENSLNTVENGSTTTQIPLKTFTVAANTVASDKSQLRVRAQIENLNANTLQVFITFGGIQIATDTFNSASNFSEIHYEASISRTASNAGYAEVKTIKLGGTSGIVSETIPFTISPDFTVSNDIVLSVICDTANGCICRQLEVVLYQYGTVASGFSIGGQYINDLAAAAGGIAVGGYYINSATGSITQRLS
jgi:hypothetical protein